MRGLGAVLACAGLAALPGAATAASLPAVGSGHRPGPDALYAPPAAAPQLEDTGIWRAKPILVSGATSYRGGEFVYQDYLYDDHGAVGAVDQTGATFLGDYLFGPSEGTYSYPTDPVYAGNAA